MDDSRDRRELVSALRRFDPEFSSEIAGPAAEWISLPDGKYQVVVEDVVLSRTEPSGTLRLLWRLRINGPAMANRIMWKSRPITPQTLQQVKEDLAVCGLNLERLSLLPNQLNRLVDVELQITKQTMPGERKLSSIRRAYSN